MHLMEMSPESATWVLRAMRHVASADGAAHPLEDAMVQAAADLCGLPPDKGGTESCTPEQLKAASLPEKDAERLIQACIMVALMDERVAEEEVELIERFADACGVSEPRLKNLSQLARGATTALWLDLARRSFAREVFAETLKTKGLNGVWKIIGPIVGRANDPELARRYIALGELPENTVGHAYFKLLVDNEFPFPGEKGAVAEAGLWHDFSHVIGGYGTDPIGELEVVSFIAGFSRQDPFFWLFTITLQFHLGVRVSPFAGGSRGHFDAERVGRALTRGASMNTDLSVLGFDPWGYFPRDLEEVRREMGLES